MPNKIFLVFVLFSLSSQACYKNCEQCSVFSEDEQDMKCTSCKSGLYKILNTNNCVDIKGYPNYFLFSNYLVPCSFLTNICYECGSSLEDYINDGCLSCNPGYKYNLTTKTCETCKENEYPITEENFDKCQNAYPQNCELYNTLCNSLENEKHEEECEKNNYIYNNKTCVISNKSYKIMFINWLKDGSDSISCPSYNDDKSDYLLIELSLNGNLYNAVRRKLFFYNDEGRGFFDEINDKNENYAEYDRAYVRIISSSMALKLNSSNEYRYLLNFENNNNNLELIDIKTGEIFADNFFNLIWLQDYGFLEIPGKPSTQLLELNEENHFLIATYVTYRFTKQVLLMYYIYYLQESKNKTISINSLKKIKGNIISFETLNVYFNEFGRFYFIQTKSGNIYFSFVSKKNELYICDEQKHVVTFVYNLTNEMSFQKLILIKDEIKFITYYSSDKYLVFKIFEELYGENKKIILNSKINKYLSYSDDNSYVDVIFLSEIKTAFVFQKANSISIFLLNFFNNYEHYMINEFILNIYGNKIYNLFIYSIVFKYRNMLGIQFKNADENGFILFGYYNTTDPKHILNFKKEGLNYIINIGNYLHLQSNIFEYEIKCVRIISVPNINESGIYLVSNVTKNYIQKNDCIDLNTEISFYLSYNRTIKKGNYLFKFVGVLQEPKYEIILNNSEQTFWNLRDNLLKNKYIEEYNERRNMNITGRVALVQINVVNDIKVFCDKKYDEFARKFFGLW